VDEAAVRNTQDVDILLRREDLDRAKESLAKAGFIYRHVASIDMFLDGPAPRLAMPFTSSRPRKSPRPNMRFLHRTRMGQTVASKRVLDLESLVRMKLNVFRDKIRSPR